MALKLFTGYHKFEVKVRRKRLFCPEWSGSFSEERSKCIRFRCFKFKRLPCQFFFKFGYVCLHERMHSSCSQILCLRASSSRSSCIVGQCCPKRFSIKTKKGSKAKVEITTLAKSTTSFTSYGKYNTFRTSNR